MVMLPLQKAEFANSSLPNTPVDLRHRLKCHQQDLCNSQHLPTLTTQNPISIDEISEVYWMIRYVAQKQFYWHFISVL